MRYFNSHTFFLLHCGLVWFALKSESELEWKSRWLHSSMCLVLDWNRNGIWILGESSDWILKDWGIPILSGIGIRIGLSPAKQLKSKSFIKVCHSSWYYHVGTEPVCSFVLYQHSVHLVISYCTAYWQYNRMVLGMGSSTETKNLAYYHSHSRAQLFLQPNMP